MFSGLASFPPVPRSDIMGLFDKLRRDRESNSIPAAPAYTGVAGIADDTSMTDSGEFSEFSPSQYGDSMVAPLSTASAAPAVMHRVVEESRQRPRLNPRPGTRVLIIDESPALISGLRRLLRQNQLEPLEAVGGERGLELAFSMQPELIFLGVGLSGRSGFNVLRTLRQDSRTRDVPVIMMSGNAQATEADYLRRLGADDFMNKPFTRADVFKRIEKLLDAECVLRRPQQTVESSMVLT